MSRYRAGSVWWLDSPNLNRAAAEEQAERYEGDAWDGLISRWVEAPAERYDKDGHPIAGFSSNENWVTIEDVLGHCIGKPPHQWTQADKNRVGRCLRPRGWKYRRLGPRGSQEYGFSRGEGGK